MHQHTLTFINNLLKTYYKNGVDKIHHDFCKKFLNISKYASSMTVQGELGRYPVMNSANSFAVKYWR